MSLLIRDVTLRDGQQSLFATRMNQSQIDRVLPYYREANFYAIEMWGGAVPDCCMRFLNENPWTRLEKIKSELGSVSKLAALSRGRNLFGYCPYPDDVIEGFYKNTLQSGIDIMRIFDALNDLDNLSSSIEFIKSYNGIADCGVCYSVDSKFALKDRMLASLGMKKLPKKVFTVDYFVAKARKLQSMGADTITIKDMAGLISPAVTAELISRLKKTLQIPVNFHTHCTPGYGLASTLMAIVNGVDCVDTAILTFAGGPAAPAFELVQLFCNKLNINTNVNLEAVRNINLELRAIREELNDYDICKQYPKEFNFVTQQLPPEIDKLFDLAIQYAKRGSEKSLIETCNSIEAWFNLPEPNQKIKHAEIPGGMYTNMVSQLKTMQLEHLMDKVLLKVPVVRSAAGSPPLVTPTSQIIGSQAVNLVLDENEGNAPYTKLTTQFVNLVKGQYGKTPIPIEDEFRLQITGESKEIPFDTSAHKKQNNPFLPEFGNVLLAENEKEELLIELFPEVASKFLHDKKELIYMENELAKKSEEEDRYRQLRSNFTKLSEDEKNEILMHGLYHYDWTSGRPEE